MLNQIIAWAALLLFLVYIAVELGWGGVARRQQDQERKADRLMELLLKFWKRRKDVNG